MHGQVPYVNLLPWRQNAKRHRRKVILIAVSLLLGFLLLGFIGVNAQFNIKQTQLRSEINAVESMHAQIHFQMGVQQKQVQKVQATLRALNQQFKKLKSHQFKMQLIAALLKQNTKLSFKSITLNEQEIKVTGVGQYDAVKNWRDKLSLQYPNLTTELVGAQSHGGESKWVIELD